MSRRVLLLALVLFSLATLSRAADRPLREVIDTEIRSAWQQEKLTPAPRASDPEFLRRVYLDLVGTIPTLDEARQFLKDTASDKRQKLIDRLVADPRFAEQQANFWDLVLFGRNPPNADSTRVRTGFKKWLAERFAKGEPFDQTARAILLAEQEGSELFYVQFRFQPEETTVAVSRIFLGTQLQCARCHDHPYESWTQRDFYGMAAFFARLVVLDGAGGSDGKRKYILGEKSTGEVLFTGSAKDQKPGKKGEPIQPKFLGGAALDEPALPKDFKEPELKGGKTPPKPAFSRKEKLAEWVTAPGNPYFPRAVANRVWGEFMGHGLVHPVDDLSEKKQPSHPKLFEEITKQLLAHKFDMKWLVRELVSSETYQLSSTGSSTDAMPRYFERGRVRPLTAEELLLSIRTATGDLAKPPGGDTIEYMLRYFGEPNNGQGEFQGGLGEHLFLNNSGNIRAMITVKKGNLAEDLVKSKDPIEDRVERLFQAVLTRPPSEKERARFVQHLASDPKKPEALAEEAIWVLLNTSEFRFNH